MPFVFRFCCGWLIFFLHEVATVPFGNVFCTGSHFSHRYCKFKNLCYLPLRDEFVVILNDGTRNTTRLMQDLNSLGPMHAGGLLNHTALHFNYVYIYPDTLLLNNVSKEHYFAESFLLVKRFLPHNLMHFFHDDILPIYATLDELKSVWNIDNLTLLFADSYPSALHLNLHEFYGHFSKEKPVFLEFLRTFSKDSLVCFDTVYVGCSTRSLWYQYGFDIPQGPIHDSTVSSSFLRTFVDALRLTLKIPVHPHETVVLFSRKSSRLILNENELIKVIVRMFKMEVLVVSLETHSLVEIIKCVSSAKVLIGMHGSGLIFSLFLPAQSVLVELFPYGVNADHYTPFKTLSNIPGMDIVYKAWRNMDASASISHPEAVAERGGIDHLSLEEQADILATTEVPRHLCCSNAYWLYRIYQDTRVNVEEVTQLIDAGLKEARSTSYAEYYLTPSVVSDITCEQHEDGARVLGWGPPWNLLRSELELTKYQLLVENRCTQTSEMFVTRDSHFEIMLANATVWVRAVVGHGTAGLWKEVMC